MEWELPLVANPGLNRFEVFCQPIVHTVIAHFTDGAQIGAVGHKAGFLWGDHIDLEQVRRSYLKNALASLADGQGLDTIDFEFLCAEMRIPGHQLEAMIDELRGKT